MTNRTRSFKATLIAAGCLLLQGQSFAHLVWLEAADNGQLVLRFGEYGEDPETSPGHLDSLTTPVAWTSSAEGNSKTVNVKGLADGYSLDSTSESSPAQAQTAFPVMGASDGKPGRMPIFYARWHTDKADQETAVEPAADLDIVPTGKRGEFQVTFRGDPVSSVNVEAHYPAGNSETLTTDETGKVTVPLDNPGIYLLSCRHHREPATGYSRGVPYDTLSHNSTVAWQVDEDASW